MLGKLGGRGREGVKQVEDEAGEDARRLGGVEIGDFVVPACAADLVKGRLQPAGRQLFVEAWGANKPILDYEF